MSEEWQPVVGYEGWYEVSSRGRVRRVQPAQGTTLGVIKGFPLRNGYLRVMLSRHSQKRGREVHRLVAEAFLGAPGLGQEVNHKDSDKLHNWVENLEWVSRSENVQHAVRSGRSNFCPGEAHQNAKLTERAVHEIRALAGTVTQQVLAGRYRVSRSLVGQVTQRKIWKHV